MSSRDKSLQDKLKALFKQGASGEYRVWFRTERWLACGVVNMSVWLLQRRCRRATNCWWRASWSASWASTRRCTAACVRSRRSARRPSTCACRRSAPHPTLIILVPSQIHSDTTLQCSFYPSSLCYKLLCWVHFFQFVLLSSGAIKKSVLSFSLSDYKYRGELFVLI